MVCSLFALAAGARAETGAAAWLRYAPLGAAEGRRYAVLPDVVVTLGDSAILGSARQEIHRGVLGLLGKSLGTAGQLPRGGAIVLGTVSGLRTVLPAIHPPAGLVEDGYWLKTVVRSGRADLVIAAMNDRGVLYGAFALLRKIALLEPISDLDESRGPYAPIRWVNEWNNLDGTIERGYAGRSIFFENDDVRADLGRAGEYARLLASIGINGCAVNNVNANPRAITAGFLPGLSRIAAAFRPWGVRMAISIDFTSPKSIGGLDSFDPLDPRVALWWRDKADEIYRAIPDLAGFVLKADSEGRAGPSAYSRTHADAANVIAHALKPHGGVLFYRGFVYDHHMDWRNPRNDRARAAYDNFRALDGQFADNAILQIKHGPIDFQVREPASPLFGGLEKTNQAIELQITQEYTGQQRHVCFLVPMWKTVLDFDMHATHEATPVKSLVAGQTFHRPTGGFVAVSNVGLDANWLGHPLASANLYGFGRLAWDPDISAERVASEWARQTFGHEPRVVETLVDMQLRSWPLYEAYTGPLGAGTLTDILGPHYGPGIESSERNGWGQWHRADDNGVGMDRTVASGTGFVGQYRDVAAEKFESLEACPDELLLFMHHVPYTHKLHSGKTVIQHIYDSHYDGAAGAAGLVESWRSLHGRVDEERYASTLARLEYQAGHARVWRDAVCSWFLRQSGIPDLKARAGRFPGRVEAESMALDGYEVRGVEPWETASGGKAVQCRTGVDRCAATYTYDGPKAVRDLSVQYFDLNVGASRFQLFVAGRLVDSWVASDTLPTGEANGHSSTRHLSAAVALATGDEIRIEGTVDAGERAPLDYVEIED
jgi:alpha-glucuronidase